MGARATADDFRDWRADDSSAVMSLASSTNDRAALLPTTMRVSSMSSTSDARDASDPREAKTTTRRTLMVLVALGAAALVLSASARWGGASMGQNIALGDESTGESRADPKDMGVVTCQLCESARLIGNAIRRKDYGMRQRAYNVDANEVTFNEDVMEWIGRDQVVPDPMGHEVVQTRGGEAAFAALGGAPTNSNRRRPNIHAKKPARKEPPISHDAMFRERVRAQRKALLENENFIADYGTDVFKRSRESNTHVPLLYAGTAASLGYKTLIDAYKKREIGALGAGQASEDAPCKILYFYHVPRTGGGTLLAHFANVGIDVQRFERSRYAKNDSALAEMQILDEDEHWHKVKTSSLRPGYHVIAHHVGRSGLLGMEDRLKTLRRDAQAQQCDFKAFTILREPERRELSEVAARPNATVEDALVLDSQARFLLVNAGNDLARSWPNKLTSETVNLPELFENTTSLLARSFDWIFQLGDSDNVARKVDAFFDIQPKGGHRLHEALRHVTNYHDQSAFRRDAFKAVEDAHDTAQEADWLDYKVYMWAREHAPSIDDASSHDGVIS